ncbi:MAG: EAL domain-containing protein [Candidatus Thiodiazotropha taylori]|nr:EAL domain-containing protein [Candidatus Thiodiazotropha taylori]
MDRNEETVHLRKYLTGIVGNAPFGIVTLSTDHQVGIINRNAVYLLGHESSEPIDLIDTHSSIVFEHVPELLSAFQKWKKNSQIVEQEFYKVKINQNIVNIKIRALFNGALIIIEDFTKTAELEELLTIRATHDKLTSLPNRSEFEERAHRAIAHAVKQAEIGAVLFIDLDRFKPINDTAGHAAGDALLRKIADILENSIRSRDIVARIGGDEFAVLLENCPIDSATEIAHKIRKKINNFVFSYDENVFKIGASIGVSQFGYPGDDLTTILNSADNACQIAKNQGRNNIHITDINQDEYKKHKTEVGWIQRIETSIADNKFELYEQKIVSLNETEEDICEILLRLPDTSDVVLSPNTFIPHAERYGMILDIDKWVLRNSFKLAQPQRTYSINLSGLSITDSKLVGFILEMSNNYKVAPNHIIFEITESAAIKNFEKALQFISELKEVGFKFALDDFGAGLSSFSYLKNLPVDFLKIDRSFIKDLQEDASSVSIINSINDVCHSLGLESIAEGIEDNNTLIIIQDIGINYAQGYLFEKPHPMDKYSSVQSFLLKEGN